MDIFGIGAGNNWIGNMRAKVGDTVIVNEPLEGDQWSHSFVGTINDIVEGKSDITYIIEDADSDMWGMNRNSFEVRCA